MKSLKIFAIFAILSIVSFSCKKRNEPTPLTPQQLILNKWKMTASKLIGQGFEFDLYADMSDCEKDNWKEYKNNGILVDDEGATKCQTTDPQQSNSNWVMSQDGKQLTLTQDNTTITFNIVELNTNSLKLKTTNFMGSGADMTADFQKL